MSKSNQNVQVKPLSRCIPGMNIVLPNVQTFSCKQDSLDWNSTLPKRHHYNPQNPNNPSP